MPFVTLSSYEFVVDHQQYDFVVVGAGGTGCPLASHLSEDKSVRVLLIESKARSVLASEDAFKAYVEPLMMDKTTRPNLTVLTSANCTCVVTEEWTPDKPTNAVGVEVVWDSAADLSTTSFFPQKVNAVKDVILTAGDEGSTNILGNVGKESNTVSVKSGGAGTAPDPDSFKVAGIDNLRVVASADNNNLKAVAILQKEYKLRSNPQDLVEAVRKYEQANLFKKQLLVTGGLMAMTIAVAVGISKSRGVRA